MDNSTKREIVVSVITTFNWSHYGLTEVDELLDTDITDAWVDDLADAIIEAL